MEDLFLYDGQNRIRIVRDWAFVPPGIYRDSSLRGPTVFEVATRLLCPTTENGGTEERPQDGYIKYWPTLAELATTIGKTERSTKNAIRKLEQLGYLSISFLIEESEPYAEIGIHFCKDKPATHQISVRGDSAREAWRSFRGGKFPDRWDGDDNS